MRRFRLLILELLALVACTEEGPPRREIQPSHEEPQQASAAGSVEPRRAEMLPASAPSAASSSAPRSLRTEVRAVTAARYLEGRCRKTSFPGWEGFPLQRCRYAVPDVMGHKSTEVILLNASAKRLERWIVSACEGAPTTCPHQLTERILWQSGAQFPVAGIVLEDVRPTDGHYELYCFRDGVRVEVEGFPTVSTERPNTEHLSTCMEGTVTGATSFARIAGTTPNDYRAFGGHDEVGHDGAATLGWLDTSRRLYQRAWKSKHNPLLDAWVAAHVIPANAQ